MAVVTCPPFLVFLLLGIGLSSGLDYDLDDYAVDEPAEMEELNYVSDDSSPFDWESFFESVMDDPEFVESLKAYLEQEAGEHNYDTRSVNQNDPYLHCRGQQPKNVQQTDFSSQKLEQYWEDVATQKRYKRSFCNAQTPNQPHEISCGCYISCVSGRFQVLRCQEGFLYDSFRRSCRPATEVRTCPVGSITPPPRPPPPPPTVAPVAAVIPGVRCPAEFGIYPHPNDCRFFVNCDRYTPHVQSCGRGTVFSRKLKVCVHPNQEDCSPIDYTYPRTNDLQQSQQAGLIQHSYNTGTSGGSEWEQNKLPTGLAQRPQPVVVPAVRCPAEFGLHPHPSDCRLFINCDRYTPHVQSCGRGTVFSRKLKVCVHPNQEDCGAYYGRSELAQYGNQQNQWNTDIIQSPVKNWDPSDFEQQKTNWIAPGTGQVPANIPRPIERTAKPIPITRVIPATTTAKPELLFDYEQEVPSGIERRRRALGKGGNKGRKNFARNQVKQQSPKTTRRPKTGKISSFTTPKR